ncbi:hypothetical protein HPB48_003865 [Haemaphysalis longicornis]|uniref:MULE transposase domain-containing protein n=1 Tax=Haemaphysalis longicornis TaxID=44386 RepID=A0A9J6FJF6_HAELO|nr:hypothetical protein HPB48_003865 [Haemaphysalis longicornis]
MGANHVEVVHTDFEIAAINVIGATVPGARIQGCFFHLSQAVYRKVCSSGHQGRYNTDEEFAVKVHIVILFASVTLSGNNPGVYCTTVHFQMRKLAALAFLRIADIPDAFEDLLQVFPTEAASVADYFEDVYIGRPQKRHVYGHVSTHHVVGEGLDIDRPAADKQSCGGLAPWTTCEF